MTTIEIDRASGFCFGVVNAIRKAEEELNKGGALYCLGDIVHNSREVDRLTSKGLIIIDREQFKELHNAKVLLRAHGEPPETYTIARNNQIEIIDATCPVVLQLQKKIKTQHSETNDSQIVIYGKIGHAEVNGLVGQTEGKAIVIEKVEDLSLIDFNRPVKLFSQTTKSLDGFREILELIRQKIAPGIPFEYNDTICRQVANRIPNIRTFAAGHELIFFVSGQKSSNGKILFEECRKVNLNSHLISGSNDIDTSLLTNVQSIGICGATSTPSWLMEEVADSLRNYLKLQR
ncbi:MAG: 4-hydroxy-3-methylbut-2-enyl diphosphate reductase [Bacteroidales bacterium]|jgi:4-hydroxy-3-methylbut-2-en-1-yl diphosphate reductase|nr:4-hydroxy-3-methylbut-2-enyl diphosphate reductase [Bacteroidales bacterium]MDD3162367.1 4-hydroxy-3-methylbut-2-enyl diphosphate reductase [Bacteroidales bacterium]MDD4638085.1 4-hydroxy-3-methylbut-2-enyl diphosphate reductase [Bacteroidales bacterium]